MFPPTKTILFPNGPVVTTREASEDCRRMLHLLGGDLKYQFDKIFEDALDVHEAYADYVAKLRDVSRPEFRGLVVMVNADSLFTLRPARGALLAKLPHLIYSTWILFVDHRTNPQFFKTTKNSGDWTSLPPPPTRNPDDLGPPIWKMSPRDAYLVVTSPLSESRLLEGVKKYEELALTLDPKADANMIVHRRASSITGELTPPKASGPGPPPTSRGTGK